MKTKQIKFLGLLGLLLAFNCSTEPLAEDFEQNTELQEKTLSSENSSEYGSSDDERRGSQGAAAKSSDQDGIPLNQVYFLYIDMDATEADYNSNPNNPSYTGPFNVYYRNLMSNHFTIYSVAQNDNTDCGNLERWAVDLAEFNQYLVSIGEPTVSNNDNHELIIVGTISNNTSGGSTTNNNSATIGGDPESDAKGKKHKDDNDDDDPDDGLFPDIIIDDNDVDNCFSF